MTDTVLLVDDDPHTLAALQRALRTEPYEVLIAEGADPAFTLLASRSIAVVVSDEAMPGLPGSAFLARVHAEYPETVRIMLTGHASLEIAIRSINEGAVYRFLTKPCHPQEVALAIRQALEQRALLIQSRRLLQTFRCQSAAIAALERENRGITRVDRDPSGAIVLPDAPTDVAALLKEIQDELDAATDRWDGSASTPAARHDAGNAS